MWSSEDWSKSMAPFYVFLQIKQLLSKTFLSIGFSIRDIELDHLKWDILYIYYIMITILITNLFLFILNLSHNPLLNISWNDSGSVLREREAMSYLRSRLLYLNDRYADQVLCMVNQ